MFSLKPLLATIGVLFFGNLCLAQISPGGVEGYSSWLSNQSSSELIANYHTIDLERVVSDSIPADFSLDQSATYFLVLKPARTSNGGSFYLRLGDLQIYSDYVVSAGDTIPIEFHDDNPAIVALQAQRLPSRGLLRTNQVVLGDASLFSIAEMIVYPRILRRDELRKVSSYLALKYSIPITNNTSTSWEDYWKPNNYYYWDTRIDRLYRENVIGLGRSDEQGLFQSQTRTTSGKELTIALNHFATQGNMPHVVISDESFVIFSQKEGSERSTIPCPGKSQDTHVLHQWKFQLQDWNSQAQSLLIQIEKEKGQKLDTLLLSDGHWSMPVYAYDIDIKHQGYAIPFDSLNNHLHYFFAPARGNDCDNSEIVVDGNQIAAALDSVIGPWGFEVQNLENGNCYNETVSGTFASRSFSNGQYIVSIKDSSGEVQSSQIVRVVDDRSDEGQLVDDISIRVFPNPSPRNRPVNYVIEGLPSQDDVTIIVSDASGKLLLESTFTHQQIISSTIPQRLTRRAGLYTLIVIQSDRLYAVKFIIKD